MNSVTLSPKKITFLTVGGLVVGLLCGLLGAGGGVVSVFILKKVLSGTNAEERDIFANTIAVILPLSAFSLLSYTLQNAASLEGVSFFILPAVIGGSLGGKLLGRIDPTLLRTLFGLLILVSGLLMLGGR